MYKKCKINHCSTMAPIPTDFNLLECTRINREKRELANNLLEHNIDLRTHFNEIKMPKIIQVMLSTKQADKAEMAEAQKKQHR